MLPSLTRFNFLEGAPVHLACLSFLLAFLIVFAAPAWAETKPPQRFGAWSVECKPRATNVENPCVASQVVAAEAEKAAKQAVVLGVMVAPTQGEPLPHIIFRFSPGANLKAGAGVKIDQQEAFRVPISQCDDHICEVRSLMSEALLSQMRAGKMLQFAYFLENQQLTYPVSLSGFDQAFAALQKTPK